MCRIINEICRIICDHKSYNNTFLDISPTKTVCFEVRMHRFEETNLYEGKRLNLIE